MWREGYLTVPSATCDGCGQQVNHPDITEVRADGHFARYCPACKQVYEEWTSVCQAEENRLNRLLDLFIETSRQKVPLRFVPQDLPRVKQQLGMVLG